MHAYINYLRFLVVDCAVYLDAHGWRESFVPEVNLLYYPAGVYFAKKREVEGVEVLDAADYVPEGGVWREVFQDAGLLLGGGRFGEGVDYAVCVSDCGGGSECWIREMELNQGAW